MSSKYTISEIEGFCSRYYTKQLPDGTVVPRQLSIVPYAYQAQFTALTAALVQTQIVNIAANADFIAFGLRNRAGVGAGVGITVNTLPVPFGRLLIVDTGTNEQFTNTAVDLQNYAPTAPFEFELPYPRIVSGRSTLSCTITCYAPAAETVTTWELSIYGVLVRAYS